MNTHKLEGWEYVALLGGVAAWLFFAARMGCL
jgi:hypothetical protein